MDAFAATLPGVDAGDLQTVADAIGGQLQGAGLDPGVLTQVVTGLGLNGTDVPAASVLGDLVGNVVATSRI